MATILLVGVDLFFRGKLEALLAGHHLITSDSVEPPEIVIADISRVDPDDVAATLTRVREAQALVETGSLALPPPAF